MIFRGDGASRDLNGFLDSGSRIQGELSFDDSFRIDGSIDGKVRSEGELIVGEQGVVEGEIEVGTLYVSGTVRARVRASRRLEITANGRVYGELSTPALIIEEGALFEGSCTMDRASEERAAPSTGVVRPMPAKAPPSG
ncbi:MAG TPA: polymer-forming cytoskeletal protein [Thermoanaerobaculia bacterium]|nr:polymer-forming cytoskeletal protein [Thermoanaerobaculia bacterium]